MSLPEGCTAQIYNQLQLLYRQLLDNADRSQRCKCCKLALELLPSNLWLIPFISIIMTLSPFPCACSQHSDPTCSEPKYLKERLPQHNPTQTTQSQRCYPRCHANGSLTPWYLFCCFLSTTQSCMFPGQTILPVQVFSSSHLATASHAKKNLY